MRINTVWSVPIALVLCGGTLPLAISATEEGASVMEQNSKPKKSAGVKKKGYDYEKSKYKSYRALTDSEPRTYRFDEKGNPISQASKKKPVKKKGKLMPPEEDGVVASEEKTAPEEMVETGEKKIVIKKSGTPKAAEYVCSMGDYRGPMTKDGRCPKCGMMLQKRQESANAVTGQAAQEPRGQTQQAVYACPMGDYRGPMTQDGRCPKCGMKLQKQ